MEERVKVFDVWVNIWRGDPPSREATARQGPPAGETGSGPPLFILTGWNGTFAEYKDLLENFAKQGFDVYGVEFPGSGKSDSPPREWRFSDFVCLIDALYGHYGIKEDAYVLGHSWGSVTALQFARYFPYRVKKLALVSSPVLSGRKWPVVKKGKIPLWLFDIGFLFAAVLMKPVAWLLLPFKSIAKVLPLHRIWHLLHHSRIRFAAEWLNIQYVFLMRSKGIMRKVLRAMIEIDTVEDMRAVDTPSLLIWGEEKFLKFLALTPARNAEAFRKNMKSASIITIPKGPHHFSGQWAVSLSGIVSEWLNKP